MNALDEQKVKTVQLGGILLKEFKNPSKEAILALCPKFSDANPELAKSEEENTAFSATESFESLPDVSPYVNGEMRDGKSTLPN